MSRYDEQGQQRVEQCVAQFRGQMQGHLANQIAHMARCGFDAVVLRSDQEPQECQAALAEISINHQESGTLMPPGAAASRRRRRPP